MNRKDLLENIRDYSPKEIVEAIRSGVVTFYDLRKYTNGQFSPLVQRKVREMLNSGEDLGETPAAETAAPQGAETEKTSTPPTEKKPEVKTPVVTTPEVKAPTMVTPEVKTPESPAPEVKAPAVEPSVAQPMPNPIPSLHGFPPPPPPVELRSCPNCAYPLPQGAVLCPSCGMRFDLATPHLPEAQPLPADMPTQTSTPKLNSFSWGGFVFSWLWGVCNGVYWSLICLIIEILFFLVMGVSSQAPATNSGENTYQTTENAQTAPSTWAGALITIAAIWCILHLVLGFTGKRQAWKSKRYASVERFEKTQKGWNIAGIIVFIITMLITGFIILHHFI